ncbi:vegetative cell wall protein gp1-like isoform X2 [Penaeus monodon]|uniref:vegetative cell wall protein gp1-like isoform X2 n=1 Tax=Penaeus monodon TaxID=6687 RepID=UPI0018A75C52|nr:vegetative cell wall protein gp1-like isoform X2 [Penaeus monodon]
MMLRAVSLVILGTCVAWAERDLDRLVAGPPMRHGVPGVQTFGEAEALARPQDLTRPLPRPPHLRNSPTPPLGFQQHPQVQPTPPPGYQPMPQVQPTPLPVQTLPEALHEDKTAPLPPKSELLRPFPRPGRPQTHPGLADGAGRPEPLPGPLPQWPQTLPAPLPGTPVVLPGILPVIPETLPATLPEEKAASLPPKSQLTKPASHPQPLPAALPQGVQTLPAVLPGRPQTLPADLTEGKTSPLPPKSELTKPASRPHQTEDNDGFAPLPTGPQVQPRPPPRDLTKPAPRPPRPQVQPTHPSGFQPAQTLPVELPSDKTAQLPPKSELLKPASRPPRPQVDPKPTPGQLTKPASRPDDSEENDGFAPLPTGPQVQPRPPPGDLTKPAPRTQHSQVQSTPPSGFQAAQVLPERPPADLKPAARPQSQASPAGKLTKPASKPVRPQRLPGELSQNPDEKQFFREDAGPFASPAEVPDVLALLPVSHQLTQVPRDVRFSCQNRYPGMYADQDYECQVFHWCLGDERMFSFLCGYGTSFNQRLLTCDYQHLVRCDLADQAYEVNTRVWNENGDFIF